jgi:hypothetical protein
MVTVPKPTQVGEKNILRRARELLLRNSANYPRNFGRRGAAGREHTCYAKRQAAAEKWPRRLFNKNTALCKDDLSRSIWCDACPMPKGQKEMLAARQSIEFKPW